MFKNVLMLCCFSLISCNLMANAIYEIHCKDIYKKINEINKNLDLDDQLKVESCNDLTESFKLFSREIVNTPRSQVKLSTTAKLCPDSKLIYSRVIKVNPAVNMGVDEGVEPTPMMKILTDHGIVLQEVSSDGIYTKVNLHSFSYPYCE